jgi:uncharacterized protein YllA (UPF0747 family)
MTHIHKHNLRLIKQYLRKTYTNDELISIANTLPDGFSKTVCMAAYINSFTKIQPNIQIDSNLK